MHQRNSTGPQPDSVFAGRKRLRGAVGKDDAFLLVEKQDRSRIAIEPFRADLLHRAQRAEPECDRERPFKVAVEQGEAVDVPGLIPAGFPRAMKRDARLHGWSKARLTNHAKARVNAPFVPGVVGMLVLFPLADDQPVVDNRLMRMGDQVLDRGINGSGVLEIFLNALHVKIDANKRRQPGRSECPAPRNWRPGCQSDQ